MKSLIILPKDEGELAEAKLSVDKLKAKGFSLLRILITGLPSAQVIVMKHFHRLINIKG